MLFRNCGPFTDCISELGHAKDIDVMMRIYNLIEYSNNYSETSGSYGNTIDTNQFWLTVALLLIFLPVIFIVLC